MTWTQTYTGRAFDLVSPSPADVELLDIAYQLAGLNRFVGATHEPYSVAEHSVRVMRAVADECPDDYDLQLAALLHDAHEAYTGDFTTPVKDTMDAGARAWLSSLEGRVLGVICRWASLDIAMTARAEIREADARMCITERDGLMLVPPKPWSLKAEAYPDPPERPWPRDYAAHQFKADFLRCQRRRGRSW